MARRYRPPAAEPEPQSPRVRQRSIEHEHNRLTRELADLVAQELTPEIVSRREQIRQQFETLRRVGMGIVSETAGEPIRLPRFCPVRFREVQLSTAPAYLVESIIPNVGIALIYGPAKQGKTFWTFDVALHITMGAPYRGRRVLPGGGVYIALEGERGIGARVAAARHHYALKDSDPPFYVITTRLGLATDVARLIDDIADALRGEPVRFIVIDTLNRSLEGSESIDEDMAAYIQALDAIREAFNCTVIVVHHTGIDDKRPRGHTSLTGAADAQIAVRKDPEGLISATVEYMKDGESGTAIMSRLRVVEVGTDDDGEPITSCVVEPADAGAAHGSRLHLKRPLTDRQQNALQALRNMFADEAATEIPPASRHIPAGRRAAPRPAVLVALEAAGLVAEVAESKRRREQIGRVLEQLQARGFVGCWQDWLWLKG